MSQRDAFIEVILEAALADHSIYFLSADFGAPALDRFRCELPGQFLHMGISEQNMVNVAMGLALSGKKPYLYAMSPFFLRCAEQLKIASFMGLPITAISVGGGLGYAGSGPSHYALEDVAFYRTLHGEVYTASDETLAREIARHSLISKRPVIARLERSEATFSPKFKFSDGYAEYPGKHSPIVTCGYLVDYFLKREHHVFDVFRLKPISPLLASRLSDFDNVHVFEEQYLNGGLGSAVIEALSDYGKKVRVFRRGVPDRAIVQNGKRDELLEDFWFTTEHHPV